jgi:hypothetical protein
MNLTNYFNLDGDGNGPIPELRSLFREVDSFLDDARANQWTFSDRELLITTFADKLQDAMKAAISLEAFLMAGEDVLMERPSQEPPMNRVDE